MFTYSKGIFLQLDLLSLNLLLITKEGGTMPSIRLHKISEPSIEESISSQIAILSDVKLSEESLIWSPV